MCNNYRLTTELVGIEKALAQAGLYAVFPEGRPNIELRDDIRITDRAPILRLNAEGGCELVQRRWSWPGPNGKPVYNFRSEGRAFPSGRCIVLADGFYEFTTPADPKAKRKHKWLFTLRGEGLFGIAGLWRQAPDVGEAFTLLTVPPGADIAPYHDRQVIAFPPGDFARWLDTRTASGTLLQPSPPGMLDVEQVA